MWLIDVRNSTLCMTSWYLDAGKPGCSVYLVTSSDLTISGSEIVSNVECSAFVVTGVVDGHSSEIQIIRTSHKSKWEVVLPLIDTSDNQQKWGDGMESKNSDNADSKSFGRVSICGVGLRMLSQHFALGTGPLFSFISLRTAIGDESGGKHSWNMTSSSRMSLGTQLFGSGVSQRVVGSCVAESTNHDSGTGMLSPNLGGNLMCLNTSFSSCIRTGNDDKDFQHKNFTQTSDPGRFVLEFTSDVTSVTFTLCTFNTMTVSITSDGGAAVSLYKSSCSLIINKCFFHKCTCTGNGGDGGAIYCSFWDSRACPVSISHSSFTQCAADDCGGSLCFLYTESLFLDYCFFDCSTADYDGAAIVESSAQVSISNTAFVDCSSNTRAGALSIFYPASLSLSFCQFRGCSSTTYPKGEDIYFDAKSTRITSDMIQSCDTTSATPNVYFEGDSFSDSSRVPQIGTTPTVNSVVVTIDNSQATVVVETQEAIKGTLSVLLNGSIVPRLVHVVFGDKQTPSTVGTAVVSSGPNGILPSATYTPHKNSFATDLFPPPTVRTADAPLKDWNTTGIVVKGVSFWEGSYWMEVEKGEKKWNITLVRSDSRTLTGTAPLYPSTAKGRLEWATEYKVTKVMWIPKDKQAEEEVTLWDTITFTTPAEPPRIEGAGCSLNGLKDVVIVELNGRALSSSDLIVVISGSSGQISSSGGLFNVTSTKCFVNFSIGLSEDDSHVVFGGRYDLLSVGSGSSSLVVNSGLFIDVPYPPRIASIVVPEDVSASTFDLSVSGEYLPSGKTFTVTLTTDYTFEISFGSAIAGTSTVKIGGSGQVQFDTTYTIKSIILSESGKEDEHILFSELSFKTPRGPTLSSISCDFDPSDPDSVKVSFSTERMPSVDFKLALENVDSPSETVELTITSSALSSGFVVVKVYKQTGTLNYGTNYRMTKMWSGNVVVVLANRLFSTPPEPIRITSASCSLGGVQEKSALVTLKGVKLGGGKEFNVTVRRMVGSAASGEDILLSGTLSGAASSTEHIHSVEIFGVSNAPLSFDTTYLITQFDVKDSISTVDADATFIVPAEPSRLTSLDASLQYSAD
ncbi:hypothetical protein BLNAU_3222 [Blattamonas nauphoetae]|uniref:Uncharacterized protein n=1 Tax=Blattamonas nauphoetae TaxID=2049346 RepID=A0ABQ9YDJ4_9EUKA|nr:hypothetical protein BLNAU_3222 [Blattamonas nauphoetae]